MVRTRCGRLRHPNSKVVDGYLAGVPEHHIPRLKGLVCPHAGYEFSGQTAAIAYKLLAGSDVQTVVVMGPSHYALFRGACIPNADAYCQDRRIDDTEQPLTPALSPSEGERE